MSYGIPAPRHRLPAEITLGMVSLQITDLNRSVEYYTKVLGFKLLHRGEGIATLGSVDNKPLIDLVERQGGSPISRHSRQGLYHFAILLPTRQDLGAFLSHLISLQVRMGAADHAVSEALYLTDPDGLGIEVYADRTRDEWRTIDQQVYMTTEGLDSTDLIADARRAGVAWRGMPAGTVMGHIHLHVGNLDEAARFYHEGLGFDKTVWDYPGALFLSAGGYHHHMGLNTWAGKSPPPGETDAQLLDWRLVVPSSDIVDSIAKAFDSLGIDYLRVDNELAAKDPWGTTVRVVVR